MNRKIVLKVFEAHNPDFPINLADKELLAYEGKKKVYKVLQYNIFHQYLKLAHLSLT